MRLMRLELKRLLKTRLNIILLLLALLLSFVMAYLPVTFQYVSYLDENGDLVKLTGMEALRYKQAVQSEIAGAVTPEKARDALECYQAVLRKYGVKESYELPEGVYGSELLPYASLVHGIKELFADPDTGVAPSLMDIDPAQLEKYDSICDNRIQALMKQEQRDHPAAQNVAVTMYRNVQKPYQLFPGYSGDAMDYQILLALLIMLICAVIAAPVFTMDYQTGADDILRCTKCGTVKLALVKIAAAFLICGLAFALCSAVYVVVSNCLFGWESTKTSIQMLYSIVNLPDMNIGNLQWFLIASGLLSLLATVGLTLLLSSRCKSIVVSLGSALVFCILPLIIYMALPDEIATWLYGILPSSGNGLQTSFLYSVIDFAFLNFGSTAIWLPHFMLGACAVEVPLFAGLAVHSYVTHHVT